MSSSSKNWCFTLNNYTENDVSQLKKLTKNEIDYIVFGKEIGELHSTPHLQGYVILKSKTTRYQCKLTLSGVDLIDIDDEDYEGPLHGIHLEKRKAKHDFASNYCKKGTMSKKLYKEFKWFKGPDGQSHGFGEGADVYEREFREIMKGEKRNGYHESVAAVIRGEDWRDIALHHPEIVLKHLPNIKMMGEMVQKEKEEKFFRKEFGTVVPRGWQINLMEKLRGPPSKRRIIWYTDNGLGRSGKSTMLKWIVANYKTQVLGAAKAADIFHAIKPNIQVFLFDFPKGTNMKEVDYAAMEKLKDQVFFSPKYTSDTKMIKLAHIVCFSNFNPDRNGLIPDRWDVYEINEEDKRRILEDEPIPVQNLGLEPGDFS